MVSLQKMLYCLLLALLLLATIPCIVTGSSFSAATAFVPSTTTTTTTTTTSPILPSDAATTSICLAPPAGAYYHKTLTIPVIGRQSFHLHIISPERARLRIDGVLQVDEELDYTVRPGGAFSLLLPDGLKRALRKFRTRLVEFGYDCTTDLPYVVVSPPLPAKIRIQLTRTENTLAMGRKK